MIQRDAGDGTYLGYNEPEYVPPPLPPVPAKLTLTGKNNDGRPRQEFADKLAAATEAEYLKIAEQYIWLSAYASNNPRSDYHWMCDAAYDEARRRGKPELYDKAWHQASGM